MARGGFREGAGRKPGSVDKVAAMAKAALEARGVPADDFLVKKVTGKVRASVTEAARELADEAIETLRSIMTNPNEPAAARVTCANSILDRAWGKAVERTEHGSAGDFDWLERANVQQLTHFIEAGEVPPGAKVN
jgi:hypothetical protein